MTPRTWLALAAALGLSACAETAPEPSTFNDARPGSQPVGTFAAPEETSSTAATEPSAPGGGTTGEKTPVESEGTCAVGRKTALGCEVTYEIDLEAARRTLPAVCAGGFTVYNDCNGEPIELWWKDTQPLAPKAVVIELGLSMFCASDLADSAYPQRQGVSVNDGSTFGEVVGDVTACSCSAPIITHSFPLNAAALASYKPGTANALHVNGPNRCIGVGAIHGDTVARVRVTY